MSSTRHNEDGTFKQERYASSPAFERGLKANLVAARLSVGCTPKMREAVWFLQHLSMKPGGLKWAAAELATRFYTNEDRAGWLSELCLNPKTNLELSEATPRICVLLADYARQTGGVIAETEIFKTIQTALDFTSEAKALTVISGRPRIGKTHAARHWAATRPGKSRLVEVPSANDDLSFFVALARVLGVTVETTAKRKHLAPRIEAALRDGDLTLILDESANLVPDHHQRPPSRPPRVSWLLELVNRGVPVALLVSPNFFGGWKDYVSSSGWKDSQFWGRVGRFVELPDTLMIPDLEAVARAWMPYANQRIIEVLADAANLSQKSTALIEHAVKLATHYAKRDGRELAGWPDVHRAIKDGLMPGDTALASALNGADARRNMPASLPR